MLEHEPQLSFRDSINVGQILSPEQAFAILQQFHDADTEDLNRSFPQLREFKGEVTFEIGSSRGQKCIIMRGIENNTPKWSYNLDTTTGSKIAKIG